MSKTRCIEEALASLSAALSSGAQFHDVIFGAVYSEKADSDNYYSEKSYQFTSMSAEIIAKWLRARCESYSSKKNKSAIDNDINNIAYSLMAAYKLSNNLGCSMADCVDAVADSYHYQCKSEALRSEVLAMPQATITLLTALPLLTLIAGEIMGANPLLFLISSPKGWCMLTVGLFSYIAGVIWVKTMMSKSRKNMMINNE